MAEIGNMIVGRLHNTLAERGIAGRSGLPSTESCTARRGATDGDRPTTIHFCCVDSQTDLWLHVVATHSAHSTEQEQAA
jgi:hypothetical protein